MKYILCCITLFLSLPILAASVSFSQKEIAIGQGVELIFSSDTPIKLMPDMAALQKDFKVSGHSSRQSTTIVNDQIDSVYQLVYNVFPKHQGNITVKGLSLNGEQLPPIELHVTNTKSASSTPTETPTLQLQAQVSEGPYYPGAGILYTVRLGDASRLLDGGFTPPSAPDTKVQVLGEDTPSTFTQNGKTILLLERRYLITPQQSGKTTISPASFTGVRTTNISQRKSLGDLWDMGLLFDGLMGMGSQEEVYASAQPIEIEILQKPSDWQGWWLASPDVQLSYSDDIPSEIKVGTTIERTITLSAENVMAEALPIPSQPETSNLRVYPATENRNTYIQGSSIIGSLNLSITMMPTNDGEITIPEIAVPWFNTKTGQRSYATIPSKTIYVKPIQDQETALKTNEPTQEIKSLSSEKTQPAPTTEQSVVTAPQMWIWLIIGIIGGGLIVLISVIILAKIKKYKRKKPLPDLYPF